MAYIEFLDVCKDFGQNRVLKNVSLKIEKGDLVTLLGPSGCGKSTLLRCLAGLEGVTSGQIKLEGKDITNTAPQKRGIGMVFQHYSLFPNMSVYDNVAFGLRQSKVQRNRVDEDVKKFIELVDLKGKEKAFPHQLSGGQQQRVALARALVNKPKVLLLDEPLSAIDAKLRKELQGRIKAIQKELKITTVFVTHDQDEAMIMSDVINLFNKGTVEQSATPVEIYTRPKTKFAAEFIGNYNILSTDKVNQLIHEIDVKSEYVAIRPESLHISRDKPRENEYSFSGKIIDHLSHGNVLRYEIDSKGIMLNCDVLFRNDALFNENEIVSVSIAKNDILEIDESI